MEKVMGSKAYTHRRNNKAPEGHSMLWMHANLLLSALFVSLFLSAVNAPADVIILKNGRRIVAESVTEVGDKVIYERSGGDVTIPKSLVERIEKGGYVPRRSRSAPRRGTGDLDPGKQLSAEIRLPGPDTNVNPIRDIESIVRDGAVDEQRLRALATMANTGELERQNAVNAYLVAASFEARQQRFNQASKWAEQALRLSRRDFNALFLAAQIDMIRQQYGEAIDHLLLAQRIEPQSPDVLSLLGHAYYYSEGPEKASRYWKQAQALRPDEKLAKKLQKLIQQAEREGQVEGAFAHARSGQFILHWEGSEVSNPFSREILATLEQQYRDLEFALDYSPREPIMVILYTARQFMDITQAPGWVGALNDGKIRVPVAGLSSVTGELASVLKHEMVHSFVYRQVQGRCPTWLHEGLAQMESGDSLSRTGPALAKIYSESRQIPLAELEGSFMGFDSSRARLAYSESLAAVAMIRDQYGSYQLPHLLKLLGQGSSMTVAIRSALRVDYEDLDAELGNYLNRRFGR